MFGESDAAVRLLPALLSCVSLGLFSGVAKRWLSGEARFFAVALYAVSPFHIWYAQEITPYAFLELGTMLTTAAFARALVSKSWLPECLGFGLGTAIAFGSQYMGVLVG